jgi:hypothetical protein
LVKTNCENGDFSILTRDIVSHATVTLNPPRGLERWRLIVGKELNHKMEITTVLRKDFL